MESEDLIQADRALHELEGHPGWATLMELVGYQANGMTHRMVHSPMKDVQTYAHASGQIQGLQQFGRIIEKVHETTRVVVRELERQAAGAAGHGR